MERHQIIEMMRELKLAGMRAAFDEILANGLKRQHSIPQVIGDLLQAEIAEKQARSIKYQVAIPRLPLAKASILATRQSMRGWCVISPLALSFSTSATLLVGGTGTEET
jgi:hypothetical protein